MNAFRFRPQRVLDWRHQIMVQARMQLVEAVVVWRRAERTVRAAGQRRREFEATVARRRKAGQTVREWQRDWWDLQVLRAAEQTAREAVARAEAAVADRRQRLAAAQQETQSLARLRERRMAEHRQAMLGEQQQELDDWAGTQHGRRLAWPGDG